MFFATIVKVKNELSNNVMQKQLKALFLIATETGKRTNTFVHKAEPRKNYTA